MSTGTGAVTDYIDVAQICLYVFWIFFAGLIVYLRREDRREGYPTESDATGQVNLKTGLGIPRPKEFQLPEGGTYQAPDFKRFTGEIAGQRTSGFVGAPYEPTGDPLLDNIGPSAYALRADEPERTREGAPAIVPIRVAADFSVARGDIDPRGLSVVGADGSVAGTVVDLWIDRADPTVRYLEVALPERNGTPARPVLLPMPMARVSGGFLSGPRIEVSAIRADQFHKVPELKDPDQITLWEEERISAFYAGGRLYANPGRAEPLI